MATPTLSVSRRCPLEKLRRFGRCFWWRSCFWHYGWRTPSPAGTTVTQHLLGFTLVILLRSVMSAHNCYIDEIDRSINRFGVQAFSALPQHLIPPGAQSVFDGLTVRRASRLETRTATRDDLFYSNRLEQKYFRSSTNNNNDTGAPAIH